MTLETDYLSYCDNRIGDADTCNSAWNAFSSSFDMKDPENVSPRYKLNIMSTVSLECVSS